MLINPRDMKKMTPEPPVPEVPAPETPQPQVETQTQFNPERL